MQYIDTVNILKSKHNIIGAVVCHYQRDNPFFYTRNYHIKMTIFEFQEFSSFEKQLH